MSTAAYAASFQSVVDYARSDAKRFYPGGDRLLSFDDPVFGQLLHDYHTTGSEAVHDQLLGHLSQQHPLARQLISYMQQVGGPVKKPRTFAVSSNGTRNRYTNEMEPDRGQIELVHSSPSDEEPASMSLTLSHPHQGQLYVYRTTIPNLHPEQLAKQRSPGQRRVTDRMIQALRRRRKFGI